MCNAVSAGGVPEWQRLPSCVVHGCMSGQGIALRLPLLPVRRGKNTNNFRENLSAAHVLFLPEAMLQLIVFHVALPCTRCCTGHVGNVCGQWMQGNRQRHIALKRLVFGVSRLQHMRAAFAVHACRNRCGAPGNMQCDGKGHHFGAENTLCLCRERNTFKNPLPLSVQLKTFSYICIVVATRRGHERCVPRLCFVLCRTI